MTRAFIVVGLALVVASAASAARPMCVAHRGASAPGYAPENTLTAFRLADAMGADGFELDLRITSDNVVVLLHDSTLQRTTNCTGMINSVPYHGYVDSCWAEGVEPVPTLRELLDYIATETKMFALFDIKDGAVCIDYMARELNSYPVDLTSRLYLAGQNNNDVVQLAQVAPKFMRSIVTSIQPSNPTNFDVANYNMNFGAITPKFVVDSNAIGISVFGWTINDVPTMEEAISYNVDAVLTDYPDVFIDWLKEAEKYA